MLSVVAHLTYSAQSVCNCSYWSTFVRNLFTQTWLSRMTWIIRAYLLIIVQKQNTVKFCGYTDTQIDNCGCINLHVHCMRVILWLYQYDCAAVWLTGRLSCVRRSQTTFTPTWAIITRWHSRSSFPAPTISAGRCRCRCCCSRPALLGRRGERS